MNEYLFLLHIFIVILFLLISLRLGKNYLIILIAVQSLLANLFVIKQIELFTRIVSCTDVFIVGTFLASNLLQEYFGRKEAEKAIKISFFCMAFFLIMAKMHLLYKPASFDFADGSFQLILKHSFRIIVSSIAVFFLAQKLNVLIFGFLKRIFKEKFLAFRMLLSSVATQLFDTILFSFLALFGIMQSIFDIIAFSFVVKVFVILISVSFIKVSRMVFKKNYEI